MPSVNHSRREVHLKVVYYGPGLGGKTTNLEHIHRSTRPDRRGKLLSLVDEAERTLFFDLLPMELGSFKGYRVRIHLCTVPGQFARDETRRRILRHVDGIVFVVDSQRGREDANRQSMLNLDMNLRLQGDDPDELPMVVQYNKMDLPNTLRPDELRQILGIRPKAPQVRAVAVQGRGVFETLKLIVRDCLRMLGDPAHASEGRTPSILPGQRSSIIPGAVPPAARVPARAPSSAPPRYDEET